MTVTREQAICMMYCAAFTEENVKKLVPTIDALEGLEICYKEEPMEPMVISIYKINAYPFLYKKYSVKQKESDIENSISSRTEYITNSHIQDKQVYSLKITQVWLTINWN